jgi:hypothetical protein
MVSDRTPAGVLMPAHALAKNVPLSMGLFSQHFFPLSFDGVIEH